MFNFFDFFKFRRVSRVSRILLAQLDKYIIVVQQLVEAFTIDAIGTTECADQTTGELGLLLHAGQAIYTKIGANIITGHIRISILIKGMILMLNIQIHVFCQELEDKVCYPPVVLGICKIGHKLHCVFMKGTICLIVNHCKDGDGWMEGGRMEGGRMNMN